MTTLKERIALDPGFEAPQCARCAHNNEDGTCKAFPQRIPDAIYTNRHDHTKPYPGDQGFQFELAIASGDSPGDVVNLDE